MTVAAVASPSGAKGAKDSLSEFLEMFDPVEPTSGAKGAKNPTAPITIPKDKRTRLIAAASQIVEIDPHASEIVTDICEPYADITLESLQNDDSLKVVKLPKGDVAVLLQKLETLAIDLDAQQDVDDDLAWGETTRPIPSGLYVPRRSIRSAAQHDAYEIALDGVSEADSFESAHRARMEVDMLCFVRSVGLDLRSTGTTFSDDVIALAQDLAYRFFRTREVRRSIDKALALLTENPRRWTIDGDTILVLPSSGSSSYQVTETCTCDDVWRRHQHHTGMCKHLALRVLLVLCQLGMGQLTHLRDALDSADTRFIGPEESAEESEESDTDGMAFIEIPSKTLLAAGGFARVLADAGQAVRFSITDSTMTVAVGDHATTVHGSDGAGQVGVTLNAAGFDQFWSAFRPQAQTLGLVRLFVTPDSVNLFDTGDSGFQVAVSGA